MEVDARDLSLRESVDRRIEEAHRDENLTATSDARGHLAAAREQIQSLRVELHSALEASKRAEDKAVEAAEHSKSLESELSRTRRVLQESDERAAEVETRCVEVVKQLSSMTTALQERDEAVSQRAEVQRQHEALKADFEGLQAHLSEVKAQKESALARVEVLEQELGTSSERIKDLSSSAEEFNLRQQQLKNEVRSLERKCLALLETVKYAEGKAQLKREQYIAEYQESDELKVKIDQACEAHLQDYKDSSEFKEFMAEACEEHLDEYKASGEMKKAILDKAYRMYVTGYNRGLREARQAPDVPLAELRRREVDSDGESVLYGEDDCPLPRGDSRRNIDRSSGSSSEESEVESEEGDLDSEKDGLHPRSEVAPTINVESSGPRDTELPSGMAVNRDNAGEGVLTDASPLRTIYPPSSPEK